MLNEKLFYLNPIYQRLLLKHRSLCVELEKARFVSISETLDTLTLKDFMDVQQNLRSQVVDRLQDFSVKLHENCRFGIKNVIENLRIQINNEMAHQDDNAWSGGGAHGSMGGGDG